jgi:hypothetical protein
LRDERGGGRCWDFYRLGWPAGRRRGFGRPSFFRGKKAAVPVRFRGGARWGGCVRLLDLPGLLWRRLFLAGVGLRLRLFMLCGRPASASAVTWWPGPLEVGVDRDRPRGSQCQCAAFFLFLFSLDECVAFLEALLVRNTE